MRPVEREKVILEFAVAVEKDGDLLAELESVESGKSIGMARAAAVGGSIDWLRYYAGWATISSGFLMARPSSRILTSITSCPIRDPSLRSISFGPRRADT
jgi:acyl-CoA reductase-like NAD-dependent aldehyde dehydrogenase